MNKFSQRQVQDQYKNLPAELKDAIFSVDVANKIFEIGKKYLLTIEETGFIAEEAGYIMLGLAHPDELAKNLLERLKIEDEEAKEIANEINSQVFYPIREIFKKAHNADISEGAEEKPAPASEKTVFETVKKPESQFPLKTALKRDEEKIFSAANGEKPRIGDLIDKEALGLSPISSEIPQKEKIAPPETKETKIAFPTPKKTEPILFNNPPPRPKIPPIDLRVSPKPGIEIMKSSALALATAPRKEPTAILPNAEAPKTPRPAEPAASPNSSIPPKKSDPYREPVE